MIKIFISILSFALLFDLCWCQNVRKGWKSKITMLVFICFRLLLRVLLHFLVSLSTSPAWRRGHLQKPEHWEREMVIPRNPVRLEVDNVAMLEKEMNVHPVEKSQIWMWKENLSVTQRDVVKQAVRSLVHSLSAYIGLSTPNFLIYALMNSTLDALPSLRSKLLLYCGCFFGLQSTVITPQQLQSVPVWKSECMKE